MTKRDSLIRRILTGKADGNMSFSELRRLLAELGFGERTKGDHHIFTRSDVEEIINLQPRGDMAKPYQVKQVRGLLIRYKLGDTDV